MITVVDMNQVKTAEPLISEVLFGRMQEVLENKKKILLSLCTLILFKAYARRWTLSHIPKVRIVMWESLGAP